MKHTSQLPKLNSQSGMGIIGAIVFMGIVTVGLSAVVMNIGQVQMSSRLSGIKGQRDSILFATQTVLTTPDSCRASLAGLDYSFTSPVIVPQLMFPAIPGVATAQPFLVNGSQPKGGLSDNAPTVKEMRINHVLTSPGNTKTISVGGVPTIEEIQLATLEVFFTDPRFSTPLASYLPIGIVTYKPVGSTAAPKIAKCNSSVQVLKSICDMYGADVDIPRNSCSKTLAQAARDYGCTEGQVLRGVNLDCSRPAGQRIKFSCANPGEAPSTVSAAQLASCAASVTRNAGLNHGQVGNANNSDTTRGGQTPGSGGGSTGNASRTPAESAPRRPVDLVASIGQLKNSALNNIAQTNARIERIQSEIESQRTLAQKYDILAAKADSDEKLKMFTAMSNAAKEEIERLNALEDVYERARIDSHDVARAASDALRIITNNENSPNPLPFDQLLPQVATSLQIAEYLRAIGLTQISSYTDPSTERPVSLTGQIAAADPGTTTAIQLISNPYIQQPDGNSDGRSPSSDEGNDNIDGSGGDNGDGTDLVDGSVDLPDTNQDTTNICLIDAGNGFCGLQSFNFIVAPALVEAPNTENEVSRSASTTTAAGIGSVTPEPVTTPTQEPTTPPDNSASYTTSYGSSLSTDLQNKYDRDRFLESMLGYH